MKILYVTTISLTINTFFKPHIEMLVNEGHQVDIACNYDELPINEFYSDLGCKFHQIDFSRSPLSKNNLLAYKQLKKVIETGEYDIVHCHTPNASVITRLVCRKYRKAKRLKVFYTAHGFHFFKGAPLLNWVVYYPIEKFCSIFTDKLITINQEDYQLAKKKFYAKEVCYVPGVGIDLSKFKNVKVNKEEKLRELGIPEDCFVLFSVGELNKNKNHQIIIRTLAKMENSNVHYIIAGEGEEKENLLDLAKQLNVLNQVHLLGFRKDIAELNHCADIFCFPSIREGLGLAAIEAMACGVPVIATANRGTQSFIINNENGFLCQYDSCEGFASAIEKLSIDIQLREQFTVKNLNTIEKFSIENVLSEMEKHYDVFKRIK